MHASPAVIANGRIHPAGAPEISRPAYSVAGRLSVHRSFNVKGAWGVSLPNGAGLGQGYPSRRAAEAAARALAPLVVDWDGMALGDVFGGKDAARKAYDAAMTAARNV